MSDSQALPVFLATGVAVLGCAMAFYFSDSESSSKRKKIHPIHTKGFDDVDFPLPEKQKKRGYIKGGDRRRVDRRGFKNEDNEDDDDDEEEEEEEEDDDEEDEDDYEEEEEEEEEDDDEEGEKFLVKKGRRRKV